MFYFEYTNLFVFQIFMKVLPPFTSQLNKSEIQALIPAKMLKYDCAQSLSVLQNMPP